MSQEFTVKKSITLNAQPQKVWNALTNPEMTKRYFFGCEVHSDWSTGSPITFSRKILCMEFKLAGNILEVRPNQLLKYNLINSKSDKSQNSKSVVTDTLTEKDGKTILSIQDNVGSGEGAEKRFKKSEKGWDKVLSGLQKILEE